MGCFSTSAMKLSRFRFSPRRTESSIEDPETRTWRPALLAGVRVELEARRVTLPLEGGIRKWNGGCKRRNTRAGACVVPLHRVAVDALCKPRRKSNQLGVTHELAGARLELLDHMPIALRRRSTLVGEQAYTATCPHTRDDYQMAGQARRRGMTRPATHGELASQ
jgi:hypothetical protein